MSLHILEELRKVMTEYDRSFQTLTKTVENSERFITENLKTIQNISDSSPIEQVTKAKQTILLLQEQEQIKKEAETNILSIAHSARRVAQEIVVMEHGFFNLLTEEQAQLGYYSNFIETSVIKCTMEKYEKCKKCKKNYKDMLMYYQRPCTNDSLLCTCVTESNLIFPWCSFCICSHIERELKKLQLFNFQEFNLCLVACPICKGNLCAFSLVKLEEEIALPSTLTVEKKDEQVTESTRKIDHIYEYVQRIHSKLNDVDTYLQDVPQRKKKNRKKREVRCRYIPVGKTQECGELHHTKKRCPIRIQDDKDAKEKEKKLYCPEEESDPFGPIVF